MVAAGADTAAHAPHTRSPFCAVHTQDLRVSVGRQEILKGITLDAHRGEILSIIGPAGAGKTTFLRCLNRMAELDQDMKVSGTVLLEGKSIYDQGMEVAMLASIRGSRICRIMLLSAGFIGEEPVRLLR